ncbi:S8 family peptidase [Cobetia sp. 4B]|uniref:S8 family peptidase n=1 Tax=Cobetia sp. 4B TaxID=2758724 RepID=UPI001C051CE7|nr:S8 family peptidase [Cobetia sp. 4B]MBR9753130.1 S8 family peptidase [Gammaproteobacteria bacterium]QWN37899.1 S8 family peptidase [Cobetia sp. 4B]
MSGNDDKRRHFIISGSITSAPYISPRRGGESKSLPLRNRKEHGRELLRQLKDLEPSFNEAREAQKNVGMKDDIGFYVEFESFTDIELAFQSLAREKSGIELLNVRHSSEKEKSFATVLVPDGKLNILEKLVYAYLDSEKDSITKDNTTKPRNSALLNTISQIRSATLEALWTDSLEEFPDKDDEEFWWEVWLPKDKKSEEKVVYFKKLAIELGFKVAKGAVSFPERSIVMVYGSAKRMKVSLKTLNMIAELRRAKETAEFFDNLIPSEQREWVDDLLRRTKYSLESETVPYICLLDSGVNTGHPFLAPAISKKDLHTIDPNFGSNDQNGHGTAMAGLAIAGDLTPWLSSQTNLNIIHRLESVKLLSDSGANGSDSINHGYLTVEAVSRPEITAPDRSRVFSMTITARDNRDQGRPSAWSSTVDRLAIDADNDFETPRLFILSAGNITDSQAWTRYPSSNSKDSIHDPAQAWNALTVGAATEKDYITESDTQDYTPIAPKGGLSPFSTTSKTWHPHWPLKPDVVFEGGNVAADTLGAAWMPSLCLLTANFEPQERLLTTANATSAATALASRMAAQLMAEYPHLWPESIRALIVHSARWTTAMHKTFLPKGLKSNKSDYLQLVRHCGFGMPNLNRAMWSYNNSLTLINQESIQPYKKCRKNGTSMNEMNIHHLPWPLEELEALGETEIKMRITLSYFIEPSPSARGITSRYRYESHGLRFDVKRPYESEQDFRNRINSHSDDENSDSNSSKGNDNNWIIGPNNRHRGSIHSDIWVGSAAELASRGMVGICPTMGWWRTRNKFGRYVKKVRYTLVVSLETPETNIDLYSLIANKITNTATISV